MIVHQRFGKVVVDIQPGHAPLNNLPVDSRVDDERPNDHDDLLLTLSEGPAYGMPLVGHIPPFLAQNDDVGGCEIETNATAPCDDEQNLALEVFQEFFLDGCPVLPGTSATRCHRTGDIQPYTACVIPC